ncbi:Na+/H+ antiporter subunit E [Halomonas huangheensis]|uniref:Cation:proton antiporter n=1 Tax=Halomonas huangheensis TaxID=1178482 RepID=W1N570_9GAMM|nr:Na+/H+ antiporter subunit E [Halomonas huangheensis]ALM51599.1 cation:proton antiporter [Halomonas huangheensis]ERL50080.1 cation:proton antiporter [Halomonas huangheensis]
MIRAQRWLPTPVLSVLLLIVWLLLVNDLSVGHLLLGGTLAIVIPLLTQRFWDVQPNISNGFKLLRFFLRVVGDIIIANLQVAWIIINPWRRTRPHFIEYPLTLEKKFAITVLASTITLTPGTVSANVRMDGKTLLIHALDVEDDETLIRTIRERYEMPLKEIFEC